MYQLLETIKIFNGEIFNTELHAKRMERSIMELFKIRSSINLSEEIRIPEEIKTGLIKCRIIYSNIIEKIEFEKYKPKKVESLRCVECNNIDYSYKYLDRNIFSELLKMKGTTDEIIIIKDGLVTDTSYSNIAFFDGREWHTPEHPLLKGTKREELLKKEIIKERKISYSDIKKYKKVSLINALLDLETIEISTDDITDI